MAEGGYVIENVDDADENNPEAGETGNFSSALANLLNMVSKCRREEPKPPDEPDDSKAENAADGENDTSNSEDSGRGKNDESSSSDDDDDESSSDGLGNTDSDSDSDEPELDRIEAFTRLDLDGMLKKATQRVNLRKLFKPGEYESLCKLLQKRVLRIENKLTLLLELGLPLPNEEIIREKIGLPRLTPLEIDSSDTDSDEDWRGRSKKRGMPIFRGVTEDGTKERMEFIRKYVEDRRSGRRQVPEFPRRKIMKPIRQRKVQEVEKPTFEPFKMPSTSEPAPDGSGDGPSTSGYNTRPKSDVKYTEEYTPEDDHFVFCDECSSLHIDDCPEHPATRMLDTKVEMGFQNRAKLTCPPGLSIDPSSLRNAGYGVWCDIAIAKNTVFGPYEGEIIKKYDVKNLGKVCDGGYSWEIHKKGKLSHYIDGSNQQMSNWMRYVNCARNEEEQNLVAFQYKGLIYYRAFKDIKANVELFVWYGTHYASQLGIEQSKLNSKYHGKAYENSGASQKKNSAEELEIKFADIVELPKPSSDSGTAESSETFVKGSSSASEPEVKVKPVSKSGKWECHICGKLLYSKHYVTQHVKYIHSKAEDFKCNICGKTLGSKHALTMHHRVHSGEKPYKCDVCGEKFSRRFVLKNHRRIHTGEKPYKCDVCGERFTRSGNLKSHRRTHTGEKPFKCKDCGRLFAHRSSLNSHCTTHRTR